MKPLALVLAMVLVPALPAVADVALVDRDLSVLIVSTSANAALVGAGVVIGRDDGITILTAAHVVPDGFVPHVRAPDGEPLAVRSIERIPNHDLALIRTAAPASMVRVAVAGRPASGEASFLWGHPGGKPFVLARAIVVDVDPQFAGTTPAQRFTIACPSCDLGDSGAGIFDERGVLLGILTAAVVDTDGHRLGVWLAESIPPLSSRA